MASLGGLVQFLPLCEAIIPEPLLRPLGKLVPLEGVHKMMQISDTISEKSKEIFMQHKKATMEGGDAVKAQVGEGNDLISILRELPGILAFESRQLIILQFIVKANMASSLEDRLPEEELIAQMSYVFDLVQTISYVFV